MSNIVIKIVLNDGTLQVQADNFAHYITKVLEELDMVGVVFVEKDVEDVSETEGA